MRNFLLGLLLLAYPFVPASAADRGGQFQNLDKMIEQLNLRPYFKKGVRADRAIKIAVFDNGFKGAKEAIGDDLPSYTKIHAGPVALEGKEEAHGFYMAKILWSLLTLGNEDFRYEPCEFHLYNTFGYSNLKAAVEDAIKRDVDVVLYSQTWEYGGNFDGGGFINALINKAVDSGILWINNAGNFGETTYNAAIKTGDDNWVELPGRNSSVEIRCEKNDTDKCNLRAVLSWNDFYDDVDQGTDKDLDFVLTDDALNVIQSSSLAQKKDGGEEPGTSKYPREIITAELDPGLYLLRVKNRSHNFRSKKDKLRITVSGDFIKMSDYDKKESILPPADNSGVITVGALDSKRSSVSYKLEKPDVWTNSLVKINKKESFKGSSNSAAMVAAGVSILLSIDPDLTKSQIIRKASKPAGEANNGQGGGSGSGGQQGPGMGLPLQALGFMPTGGQQCFVPVPPNVQIPSYVQNALAQGGTLVYTTAGWKILYPFDPIQQLPIFQGFWRRASNDMLLIGPQGPSIYARQVAPTIPGYVIELLQVPYGMQICGNGNDGGYGQGNQQGNGRDSQEDQEKADLPSWARIFRLPNRS